VVIVILYFLVHCLGQGGDVFVMQCPLPVFGWSFVSSSVIWVSLHTKFSSIFHETFIFT